MSSLAKPDEQPHFDSSDMLIINNMFRREFALMPGLVRGVAAGRSANDVDGHIACVSRSTSRRRTLSICPP